MALRDGVRGGRGPGGGSRGGGSRSAGEEQEWTTVKGMWAGGWGRERLGSVVVAWEW